MKKIAKKITVAKALPSIAVFIFIVAGLLIAEQSGPADEALLVADANEGFDFEQASAELTPAG